MKAASRVLVLAVPAPPGRTEGFKSGDSQGMFVEC